MLRSGSVSAVLIVIIACTARAQSEPRARDLGVPFEGTPGKYNAITDVAGVEVGEVTLISGSGKRIVGKGPVRTGKPHVGSLIATPMLLLMVVLFAMLALRFLDPTAFIAMPLIFLPLEEPLAKAGIPPLVLTAPLLLASAPFWLLYMNFWMAMGDSVTQKQGFTQDADVQYREYLRGFGDPGVHRRRVLLADDRHLLNSLPVPAQFEAFPALADMEISVTRSRPLSRISIEPRTPLPDISATINRGRSA